MLASSQCQRPNAEAGEAHKAYTLTSFGTRQGQAEATTGESRVDRPPPGRRCPLTLALQTLPALLPLHGLPGRAGTATCSDSARGPGWTVPGSRAGRSPSVCVYVRVMLPLLLPQPGGRIHTGIHAHDGLGTWPPELLPELDLMQTFLCLLGRGTSEGPGSKPVGLRATAEQGAAPGFRHTTTTRACAHACPVCSCHMHPPTHASHAVHLEAAHVSHSQCQSTSASHMLPFSHPPRDTQRLLLPDPPLPPATRSPARRGV